MLACAVTIIPRRSTCADAGYPEGSKVLSGADQQYIIAPLGNIVEESYTPYFDFKPPDAQALPVITS